MIGKEKTSAPPVDKYGRAGFDAELQMAFYLRRAFGEASDIVVLNDLRLERNGEFAQIDHLVFHRFGFVIVESKSVVGSISVNQKGEFSRTFDGITRGMPSPIRQALLQAELLEKLLNDHKDRLRRKVLLGLAQGYFGSDRFRILVAISDSGIINRQGCDPPELFKAEQVVEQIRETIRRHTHATSITGFMGSLVSSRKTARQLDAENLPAYTAEEAAAIQKFLLERHTPLTAKLREGTGEPPKSVDPSEPMVAQVIQEAPAVEQLSCRQCKSFEVTALHGRFGYYLKCNQCQGNTPIDQKCANCGEKGRIQKSKERFTRICEACGTQTLVHLNATEK